MKHLQITTIAAMVLVGCGESQQSSTSVKQQPKPLSEADKALLKAANRRNIIYVKQAIVDGADVNAKNHIRLTPLHIAADRGHKEVGALLIDKGADVNAMGGEGDKDPYGNGDGKVDDKELQKYLDDTMTYYARRYYGRDQRAQITTIN